MFQLWFGIDSNESTVVSEDQGTALVSEFGGWLFKKGHGNVHIGNMKIKKWKRRFFVLHISSCTMLYYKKEPTANPKQGLRGELRITNFSEPELPIERPPKNLNGDLGLILNTTNPSKPTVLICAETMHEKSLWITYLQLSLNPTKALRQNTPQNLHHKPTWRSMRRIAYLDNNENDDDDDDININNHDTGSDHSEVKHLSDGVSSNTSTVSSPGGPIGKKLTSLLPNMAVIMLACLIFDVGTLARMSVVSKAWYRMFSRRRNHKLWKWLVERGAVSYRERWSFWQSCVRSLYVPVPSQEEFERLTCKPTESVLADIRRDVDRSFGNNPNKRQALRRSFCLHDDDARKLLEIVSGCPMLPTVAEDGDSNSTECYDESSHIHHWVSKHIPGLLKFSSDSTAHTHLIPRPSRAITLPSAIISAPPTHMTLASSAMSPLSPARPRSFDKVSTLFRTLSPFAVTDSRGHYYDDEVKVVDENMGMSMNARDDYNCPELNEEDKRRKRHCLTRILSAIAARFEEVGYCQGLDRVVLHAMRTARCAVSDRSLPLALVVRRDQFDSEREREVYAFIEALFMKMHLTEMYSKFGVVGLRVRVAILARLIEKHCPELFEHISQQGLPVDAFGISWIQTLFLYVEAMPALTIDKIWDIFLVDGRWNIIYSVAIAILQMSEQDLLTKHVDEIIYYLYNFPDPNVLDHRILLEKALAIDISTDYITELESEIRLQMQI